MQEFRFFPFYSLKLSWKAWNRRRWNFTFYTNNHIHIFSNPTSSHRCSSKRIPRFSLSLSFFFSSHPKLICASSIQSIRIHESTEARIRTINHRVTVNGSPLPSPPLPWMSSHRFPRIPRIPPSLREGMGCCDVSKSFRFARDSTDLLPPLPLQISPRHADFPPIPREQSREKKGGGEGATDNPLSPPFSSQRRRGETRNEFITRRSDWPPWAAAEFSSILIFIPSSPFRQPPLSRGSWLPFFFLFFYTTKYIYRNSWDEVTTPSRETVEQKRD